jgi:hypothetical protein
MSNQDIDNFGFDERQIQQKLAKLFRGQRRFPLVRCNLLPSGGADEYTNTFDPS